MFLFTVLALPTQGQILTDVQLFTLPDPAFQSTVENNASSVLNAINKAHAAGTLPAFDATVITPKGQQEIHDLWERAAFQCLNNQIRGPLVKRYADNNFEFRDIPLHLSDSNQQKHQETGILLFNDNGQVDGLYYGLDNAKYQSLLRTRRDIEDFTRRQLILDFVENFRTAYNRKDISFLEDVFSNNALIIVGKVVQQRQNNDASVLPSLSNDTVEYIQLSKTQYLERLQTVFERNEFVKVDFADIEIFEHPRHQGIYGVQTLQSWSSYSFGSQGYADKGYLFLMIDFRNGDDPMIHVRTWQPEEFTNPEDAIDLGDFVIR